MKLATTTGDYQAYTYNQDYAISMIKDAGFKYIDYSFIMDYKKVIEMYNKRVFKLEDKNIVFNYIKKILREFCIGV